MYRPSTTTTTITTTIITRHCAIRLPQIQSSTSLICFISKKKDNKIITIFSQFLNQFFSSEWYLVAHQLHEVVVHHGSEGHATSNSRRTPTNPQSMLYKLPSIWPMWIFLF